MEKRVVNQFIDALTPSWGRPIWEQTVEGNLLGFLLCFFLVGSGGLVGLFQGSRFFLFCWWLGLFFGCVLLGEFAWGFCCWFFGCFGLVVWLGFFVGLLLLLLLFFTVTSPLKIASSIKSQPEIFRYQSKTYHKMKPSEKWRLNNCTKSARSQKLDQFWPKGIFIYFFPPSS